MSLLELAVVAVIAVVIALAAGVYWHESRRPETRSRPEATGQDASPVERTQDPDGRRAD